MKYCQLRNHIPIAGPARREPADGTESDLRVSLGFVPAWYRQRGDVDFSERWHTDPYYRATTLKQMKAELLKAFPSAGWDAARNDDLTTISGCYGSYMIPNMFGIPLRYTEDRWPQLHPQKLSLQEIEQLTSASILNAPIVENLFRQMDIIAREWGLIHGYMSWQGVLNNAFNIRGQEIFVDLVERPDFAHQFFSLIADVMIQIAQSVQRRQRESGFNINQFSVSNCVMNMISPRMYTQFIFPYDKKIAKSFERFGVHTCNWNVTPYLKILSNLPKLGYLDLGMMSDMRKARAMFPETRRAVLYSPVRLQDASVGEIRVDLGRIYREFAPCDVIMADIQARTPDHRVHELLNICRELESER